MTTNTVQIFKHRIIESLSISIKTVAKKYFLVSRPNTFVPSLNSYCLFLLMWIELYSFIWGSVVEFRLQDITNPLTDQRSALQPRRQYSGWNEKRPFSLIQDCAKIFSCSRRLIIQTNNSWQRRSINGIVQLKGHALFFNLSTKTVVY